MNRNLKRRALGGLVSGLVVVLLVAQGCGRSEPKAQPTVPKPVAAPEVRTEQPTAPPLLVRGKELYANYCSACHGETGDGAGPAAAYLYPKPRNFRSGKFRIVTTTNRVPADKDLMKVVTEGMPGSAMFPFRHLDEGDRAALVQHVRELTRQGIEQQIRRDYEEAGDEVDPDELAEDVASMTRPDDVLELPDDWPAADDGSVARGRELYVAQGCVSCHGETGKGDGVQEQRDDDGMPTRPRDFTRGIFKGGRDRLQLYARIVQGMPGTPMPSSSNLEPAQIGDLVNYVQSLSDETAQGRVQHKRQHLLAKRVAETLPDEISAEQWAAAEAVPIVVSPLWWRDYPEPDFHVQALHDDSTLVLRLIWNDATRNDHVIRPQDFQDMTAVELFHGPREPFLGMGALGGGVDVWLWQAGWQADLEHYADVDTAYPNMAVDLYPFEKAEEGRAGHPTQAQPRSFLTAAAAGNLRADPQRQTATSDLQAEGFGTLTMRPPISQLVHGKGQWTEERWSVEFRRPLAVDAAQGLPLAPGEKLSIAFAIWDGAAADRDGKKLVSIWHDLELE